MENKDLFAPPTKEELELFSAPTTDELRSLDIEPSKSSIDSIGETASDFGRAALSGVTIGGIEEMLAGGKAALSDEKGSFRDLYRKYLDIEEKRTREAEKRSPVATTVGELAGALAPAFVTGGGSMALTGGRAITQLAGKELAKAAGKAALVEGTLGAASGALAGSLSSEGKLIGATPEERELLLKDAREGLLTGGALGGAAGAVSPLIRKGAGAAVDWAKDKLDDTIIGKQLRQAFKLGEAGGGYISEPQKIARAQEISKGVEESKDIITSALDKAGERIGDAIDVAESAGAKVSVPEKDVKSLIPFLEESGEAELVRDLMQVMGSGIDPITLTPTGSSVLTPKQAYALRTKLKDYTYKDPNVYRKIKPFVKSIDDQIESAFEKNSNLKSLVQEQGLSSYRQAMDAYTNLADALPETIIGKGARTGERGAYYGDRVYRDKILREGLESLVSKRYRPGEISSDAIKTMESSSGGLHSKLTTLSQDPENKTAYDNIAKSIGFKNIDDLKGKLISKIEDTAEKASTKGSAIGYDAESLGVGKSLTRQSAIIGANIAGESKRLLSGVGGAVKESMPVRLSKQIYSLPETSLQDVAKKLQESPRMSKYGKNLADALAAGDNVKKDAALFLMMQNPETRAFLPEVLGLDGSEE